MTIFFFPLGQDKILSGGEVRLIPSRCYGILKHVNVFKKNNNTRSMKSVGLKRNQRSNGFNICVFKRLLTTAEYMCQYNMK